MDPVNPQQPPVDPTKVLIAQNVAILVDGNNIERSIAQTFGISNGMANFDDLIPKLLGSRALNRFIYFREGHQISSKLAERLHDKYFGSVQPCHKSADIPLSIKAMQLSGKVDTIIIMSGDSDYIELIRHLKFEGVRVEICAVKENTAQVVMDEADYFLPLAKEDCFVFGKNPGRPQNAVAIQRSSGRSGGGRGRSNTSTSTSTSASAQTEERAEERQEAPPRASDQLSRTQRSPQAQQRLDAARAKAIAAEKGPPEEDNEEPAPTRSRTSGASRRGARRRGGSGRSSKA